MAARRATPNAPLARSMIADTACRIVRSPLVEKLLQLRTKHDAMAVAMDAQGTLSVTHPEVCRDTTGNEHARRPKAGIRPNRGQPSQAAKKRGRDLYGAYNIATTAGSEKSPKSLATLGFCTEKVSRAVLRQGQKEAQENRAAAKPPQTTTDSGKLGIVWLRKSSLRQVSPLPARIKTSAAFGTVSRHRGPEIENLEAWMKSRHRRVDRIAICSQHCKLDVWKSRLC